jgi:hypothetical protein
VRAEVLDLVAEVENTIPDRHELGFDVGIVLKRDLGSPAVPHLADVLDPCRRFPPAPPREPRAAESRCS